MKHNANHDLKVEYPDYHQQPLRLNSDEIQNPEKVIDAFFDMYDLKAARIELKQMRDAGLQNGNGQAIVHLHETVEKLIEAAWLLRKKWQAETI